MVGRHGVAHDVENADLGLWCRRGEPPRMDTMHRHNDVEINVVLRGELRYLHAGRPLVVREGETALFWAAQPHGLIDSRPGDVCWVHVPLSLVMTWGLPEEDLGPLLRAEPLLSTAASLRDRALAMVDQWEQEVPAGGAQSPALLEVQAFVRRALREAAPRRPGIEARGPGRLPGQLDHVRTMVEFVMQGYRDPLDVADIARAAHLAPSHAMTVFRRAVGITIGQYVTMCRVAEAQRLLLTSDLPTADIAAASGFGSLSSFYHHVGSACGMPPRAYRRQGS